jgi:predicted nucleotidyltransferase
VPATNVEKLLRALYDQEVEFIIIGGASAVLHGSAYVTADLDICYSREKENLKRLAAALAPFNRWEMSSECHEKMSRPGK